MYPTTQKTKEKWILILTSIAAFMVVLDSLVVSVTLSTIRQDFHATIEQLEWTVNAYSLSFAVLLLTASALGDRYGRKRMFISGLILFLVSSAFCALSDNITWLVTARVIQGAGAAFVMPLAMSILSAEIPAERRGRALGIFTGIAGLAILSGPVVGGAVTEGMAWQWIFWLNLPIGLLLLPFVIRKIPESFGGDVKLDIGGLLTVIVASFGLVWGLVRGNQAGWLAPEVVAAFAMGILFTYIFIRWEKRVTQPMVPMQLFRIRSFSYGNIASFFLYGSIYSTVFFVAQFLQIEKGYSPLDAGLRVLPWTATVFIIAPISGALVNKIGERRLIFIGMTMQAIGYFWLASVVKPDVSYMQMIIPFLLAGGGASLAMPATQNAVLSSVSRTEVGKASGVFNMLRQLGAAFGIAILVVAFSSSGGYSTPQHFNDGFVTALVTSAILSFVSALAGGLLPGRQKEAALAIAPQALKKSA